MRVPTHRCRAMAPNLLNKSPISLRIYFSEIQFLVTCSSCEWILVGARCDLNALRVLVVAEPSPSRALYGHGCLGEFLFKCIETAKLLGQFALQIARRTRLFRAEIFPENRMIDVAAAVELQRALQCDYLGCVILLQSLLQLHFGRIEVGDVRLMMLLMMQLHDFARNNRFECFKVEIQLGQCMLFRR